MANNNNGRETPKNQPIPSKTPNAPRRPRRTPTPNRSNTNAAFETPPRPVRTVTAPNAQRVIARRLNFNDQDFFRFLNTVLLNTPAPRTPAQKTPKRSKKNKGNK